MSLLQFAINLLAGFVEKEIVVGERRGYLFEYDLRLDNGDLMSIKTNGHHLVPMSSILEDFFSDDYDCNYRVGTRIPGSS